VPVEKTALITGTHGFLGRYAALQFANAGYVVTGMGHGVWDRAEFSQFGISFWHSADISIEALVTYAGEPDVIVHCAGSGSVAFSMIHPFQDYARTVSSTAAVLKYIGLHSSRTVLVYSSSAAVYGVTKRLPIKESDALQPASPYGVHKLLAERLCRSYADTFGVEVELNRFFSIYGNGLRKQLLWDACSKSANRESAFFGAGAELRDWLHVEDAAQLLLIAASRASSACPIVNGGSGKGVAVSEVLSLLFTASGSNPSPSFNGNVRAGDPPGQQADVSNAQAWGWYPRIKLEEGIQSYVGWFKRGN